MGASTWLPVNNACSNIHPVLHDANHSMHSISLLRLLHIFYRFCWWCWEQFAGFKRKNRSQWHNSSRIDTIESPSKQPIRTEIKWNYRISCRSKKVNFWLHWWFQSNHLVLQFFNCSIWFFKFQFCCRIFQRLWVVHLHLFLNSHIDFDSFIRECSNGRSMPLHLNLHFNWWKINFNWTLFFACIKAIEFGNPLKIVQAIIVFCVWTILFYLFCTFGDEMATRFENVENTIYSGPWFKMPMKFQKKLHMMMVISQKPLNLRVSGVHCNRRLFIQVMWLLSFDDQFW